MLIKLFSAASLLLTRGVLFYNYIVGSGCLIVTLTFSQEEKVKAQKVFFRSGSEARIYPASYHTKSPTVHTHTHTQHTHTHTGLHMCNSRRQGKMARVSGREDPDRKNDPPPRQIDLSPTHTHKHTHTHTHTLVTHTYEYILYVCAAISRADMWPHQLRVASVLRRGAAWKWPDVETECLCTQLQIHFFRR